MRLGVVGTGRAADVLARALVEQSVARMSAVCSRDPMNAVAFARRWGIPASCDDWQSLVSRADIDAVYIATPPASHAEIGVAAALSGKHVLVEKPIARTLQEADSLIQACHRAGTVLACVFPHRFLGPAQKIHEAVHGGRLGKLVAVACEGRFWRAASYYEGSGWRSTWAGEGGAALTSQLIHTLDLVLWIGGEVGAVAGYYDACVHDIETEDTVVASLRFRSGALGAFIGGTSFFPGYSRRVDFHCSRGTVGLYDDSIGRWDAEAGLPGEVVSAPLEESGNATGVRPQGLSASLHGAVVRDFVSACDSGHGPMVDGDSARQSLELILAIRRSSERGQSEFLPLEK